MSYNKYALPIKKIVYPIELFKNNGGVIYFNPTKAYSFALGEDIYDIPRSEVTRFTNDNPQAEALIPVRFGCMIYEVKEKNIKEFIKLNPQATPYFFDTNLFTKPLYSLNYKNFVIYADLYNNRYRIKLLKPS
jgi:hypothetical protein